MIYETYCRLPKNIGLTKDASLADLKILYRNLVKEWHPDKYQETDDMRKEAELKSQAIINAYHFLVSISPETHALQAEQYALTTTDCLIDDFVWKGHTLKITFQNGSTYEYLGVPHSLYTKLINSSTPSRFVRRHIVGGAFVYRNISKNAAIKL